MYFGGQHNATAVETVDLPFTCAKCGAEKTARITAQGHGTANSPYFIGGASAKNRAAEEAFVDARSLAEETLGVVACPACGHRKKSARSFNPLPVFAGVSLGGVGGLFLGGGGGAVIGACGGALLGLASVAIRRSQTTSIADSVLWFDGEPPDKPVIGKKCKVCTKQIVLAKGGIRCEQCGAPLHTKKCADEHARKAHGPEDAATPYRS